MKPIPDLLSHHANLIIGGESRRGEIISILEKKYKIPVHANPDLTDRAYGNFTIEDAREIKALAETRPMTADAMKIFVLTMNGITVEAQNAMLKLLEEPPAYARFFLIIPSAHLLLPTVKSRLCIVGGGKEGAAADLTEAKKFLKASVPKRLEMIKILIDDISKEKLTKKDAVDYLNAIQAAVYEDQGAANGFKALQSIEISRKYINDRAPSLKMLLEYVALNV